MAKKIDPVEEEVEFVPSPSLVDAMNSETDAPAAEATDAPPEEPAPEGDSAADMPPSDRYRILQPWLRHTLVQRLNEEAAAGWRLAATVDNTIIILERAE